jgi:hypothetical protein
MVKNEITDEVKQKTLEDLNALGQEDILNVGVDPKTNLVTRVTSIAKEEELTGEKIELPSAEKLVANASAALYQTRKGLAQVFSKMSKKQTIRAITAIFSLPEDNIPVGLKTDEEKMAYALAQRHMMSRFLIMQKHVADEVKRRKSEEELAKQTSSEESNNTQESSNE